VPTDFAGLASLLTESQVLAVEGWIMDRPVSDGGVIASSAVVEPGAPSGLRSMSIPINAEHAAGGAIRAGDRVDVISVSDEEAAFVVSDVGVISVANSDGDAFGVAGDYFVVVAVDAAQALVLAKALDSGSVELLRSTGAPPIGPDLGS
jgi:Flp pilus assembly protein CpaB